MLFSKKQTFIYTEHALLRMSQRQISKSLVLEVLYSVRMRFHKGAMRFEKGGLIVILDKKSKHRIITVYLDGEDDALS